MASLRNPSKSQPHFGAVVADIGRLDQTKLGNELDWNVSVSLCLLRYENNKFTPTQTPRWERSLKKKLMWMAKLIFQDRSAHFATLKTYSFTMHILLFRRIYLHSIGGNCLKYKASWNWGSWAVDGYFFEKIDFLHILWFCKTRL